MTAGTMSAAVRPAATMSLASAIFQRGDRLDHQVDRRAVLELGADGGGAEDQRDERQDRPDDERVEDPVGVRTAAARRARAARSAPAAPTSRSSRMRPPPARAGRAASRRRWAPMTRHRRTR